MSRWGYSSNRSDTEPDFDKMFEKQGFSAVQLLDIDSIVEEVKRSTHKFTPRYSSKRQRLIEHPQIVLDLFQITLRPEHFSKMNKIDITLDMVYKGIEILTNQQSEQFADFLLGSQPTMVEQDEDEVLQEEIQLQRDISVFLSIFEILKEKKPICETAASYLNRILTPIFYVKSSELIGLFLEKRELFDNLLEHYYSRSISDIFSKIIEVEEPNGFYGKEKLSLINHLPEELGKEKDIELLTLSLENFSNFFDTLLQKYQDRYDKAKYVNLVREVVNEKQNYQFLIENSKKYPDNPEIQSICFCALQILLRFSTGKKLSNANSSKLSNANSSKLSDSNMDTSIAEITINIEVIKEIENFIVDNSQRILQRNFKSTKIPYYRIIQSINIIDPTFIQEIVDVRFVRRIFISMLKSPRNNILHNILKQILIEAIQKSDDAYEKILNVDSTFLELTKEVLSAKNSKYCYENQIYHIASAVLTKISNLYGQLANFDISESLRDSLKDIQEICHTKKQFYSVEIGGNPRKQSQNWDCSESEIFLSCLSKDQIIKEIIVQTNKIQQKDEENIITGGNHWLDNELPLDSDQSNEESSDQDEKKPLECDSESNRREVVRKNQEEEQPYDNSWYRSYLQFDLNEIMNEFA